MIMESPNQLIQCSNQIKALWEWHQTSSTPSAEHFLSLTGKEKRHGGLFWRMSLIVANTNLWKENNVSPIFTHTATNRVARSALTAPTSWPTGLQQTVGNFTSDFKSVTSFWTLMMPVWRSFTPRLFHSKNPTIHGMEGCDRQKKAVVWRKQNSHYLLTDR